MRTSVSSRGDLQVDFFGTDAVKIRTGGVPHTAVGEYARRVGAVVGGERAATVRC